MANVNTTLLEGRKYFANEGFDLLKSSFQILSCVILDAAAAIAIVKQFNLEKSLQNFRLRCHLEINLEATKRLARISIEFKLDPKQQF